MKPKQRVRKKVIKAWAITDWGGGMRHPIDMAQHNLQDVKEWKRQKKIERKVYREERKKSDWTYAGTLSGVYYTGLRGYLHNKVDYLFEHIIPSLKNPIHYRKEIARRYCSDRNWDRHFGHQPKNYVDFREKIYRLIFHI